LFRRSKPDPNASSAASAVVKEGGKGRATPTRRDAEAARRARAKGPQNKKEAARLQRQRRSEANVRMREGMRTGDDRYLPARDKGPVRRFVRDFVDARLCMAELLLPMLVVILITGAVAPRASSGLWSATILVILLDTSWLVFRLRRELSRRFSDRSTKGAVLYGVMRSIQLRWIRMPKAQVKLGARLPERY
jgi:hypothetical protein